jgi:hypothetical protein
MMFREPESESKRGGGGVGRETERARATERARESERKKGSENETQKKIKR